MKWKCLALFFALASALATTANAKQPTLSPGQSAETPAVRRPVYNDISWWVRYGEPVAAIQPDVAPAPAEVAPGVLHDEGYGFGYVYGPGACDCPPPCIDKLWAGYEPHYRRCTHPIYNPGRRHCGNCGSGSHCGCNHGCGAPACSTPSCTAPAATAPAAPAAPLVPPAPMVDTASVLKKPSLRRISVTTVREP